MPQGYRHWLGGNKESLKFLCPLLRIAILSVIADGILHRIERRLSAVGSLTLPEMPVSCAS